MPTKFRTSILVIGSAFILSGCMSSVLDKEITKSNDAAKGRIEEEADVEVTPENVELSAEQKEILAKMERKEAEEALYENDLEVRREIEIKVPQKQTSFTDVTQFSQYISHLFFAFHTGKMDTSAFVDEITQYAHPDYLAQLPESREDKIKAFEILKERYTELLTAPIESYRITETQEVLRSEEVTFYRKFVLDTSEELYSITVLKKDNNVWKLLDDSPSAPYVTK